MDGEPLDVWCVRCTDAAKPVPELLCADASHFTVLVDAVPRTWRDLAQATGRCLTCSSRALRSAVRCGRCGDAVGDARDLVLNLPQQSHFRSLSGRFASGRKRAVSGSGTPVALPAKPHSDLPPAENGGAMSPSGPEHVAAPSPRLGSLRLFRPRSSTAASVSPTAPGAAATAVLATASAPSNPRSSVGASGTPTAAGQAAGAATPARLAAGATPRQLRLNKAARIDSRADVLGEILDSEQAFVGYLNVLQGLYINPLRNAAREKIGLVSDDDLRTIFGSVEVLLSHNSDMLARLQARLQDEQQQSRVQLTPAKRAIDANTQDAHTGSPAKKQKTTHMHLSEVLALLSTPVAAAAAATSGKIAEPRGPAAARQAEDVLLEEEQVGDASPSVEQPVDISEQENASEQPDAVVIGDIFLEYAPYLKVFSAYVNNFERSRQKLKELQDASPVFNHFLENCVRDPQCKGQSIQSLLIMPVQRVPRYVLLLTDLMRKTPKQHPGTHIYISIFIVICVTLLL
eukprot:TRINITY_DN7497_c0_g1_i2.p1 TRINITY_DN7497_c0_g1~~TRINITY_DN7497_c0_g1_i2.p1  ORF type:complete len:516 (-),score=106.56 TRINITY_DN7497_c0_g1_i2:61-1608(-)